MCAMELIPNYLERMEQFEDRSTTLQRWEDAKDLLWAGIAHVTESLAEEDTGHDTRANTLLCYLLLPIESPMKDVSFPQVSVLTL